MANLAMKCLCSKRYAHFDNLVVSHRGTSMPDTSHVDNF